MPPETYMVSGGIILTLFKKGRYFLYKKWTVYARQGLHYTYNAKTQANYVPWVF